MKFKTLNDKERNINISKYIIDWDAKSASNFQFAVKQFLYKYWMAHCVCEEFLLVGTKLRLDFFNITRNIAVEANGIQHNEFNKFFHGNSRAKYLAQIKRDVIKQKWCDKNKILLVEINPDNIDDLCPEWFMEKYDVSL